MAQVSGEGKSIGDAFSQIQNKQYAAGSKQFLGIISDGLKSRMGGIKNSAVDSLRDTLKYEVGIKDPDRLLPSLRDHVKNLDEKASSKVQQMVLRIAAKTAELKAQPRITSIKYEGPDSVLHDNLKDLSFKEEKLIRKFEGLKISQDVAQKFHFSEKEDVKMKEDIEGMWQDLNVKMDGDMDKARIAILKNLKSEYPSIIEEIESKRQW